MASADSVDEDLDFVLELLALFLSRFLICTLPEFLFCSVGVLGLLALSLDADDKEVGVFGRREDPEEEEEELGVFGRPDLDDLVGDLGFVLLDFECRLLSDGGLADRERCISLALRERRECVLMPAPSTLGDAVTAEMGIFLYVFLGDLDGVEAVEEPGVLVDGVEVVMDEPGVIGDVDEVEMNAGVGWMGVGVDDLLAYFCWIFFALAARFSSFFAFLSARCSFIIFFLSCFNCFSFSLSLLIEGWISSTGTFSLINERRTKMPWCAGH